MVYRADLPLKPDEKQGSSKHWVAEFFMTMGYDAVYRKEWNVGQGMSSEEYENRNVERGIRE